MDFGYSQKVLDLQAKLRSFMTGLVLPHNERWHREVEAGSYPLELVDELRCKPKCPGSGTCSCPDFAMMNPGRG